MFIRTSLRIFVPVNLINRIIRMTKQNYDITRMQRDALLAAYCDVCAHYRPWSQQDAYAKTAKHPAPRYYVTAKEAYEKLRRMAVGDNSVVDALGDSKRRMYYSLFERLKELTQRREYVNKSLWFLCPILVSLPAPEFFMSPRTVKDIHVKYRVYGSTDFRHREVYGSGHKNKAAADNA